MKHIFTLFAFLLLSVLAMAQVQYEVSRDPRNGNKVLKGIISKSDISADTAFAWFAENQKGYSPNAGAIEGLRKNAGKINLVVFSGTWCSDSKNIIPKFFSLLDTAGFPLDRVTLIGTDRTKKTIGYLAEAFNIVNVPTIIVMKDGKEIGRVVEYGKYGLFDMELAEIMRNISAE